MKKLLITIAIAISLSASAQTQKKPDSLVLQIQMDSTTFKNVVSLIQENISGQTKTGQLLLQNILAPLYNFKWVPAQQQKKP